MIKLRYSPRSPFVRKVLVAVIETGQRNSIELVLTRPSDPQTDLSKDNPLGQIPTLITDDGEPLYDSAVICEYLDSLHGGEPLFPATGKKRWTALRLQALGDGVIEAAVARTMEQHRRPEAYQWEGLHEQQQAKINRALDRIEEEMDLLEGRVTIAEIAIGCGLGYLDFRQPEEPWRDGHPRLAAWYEQWCARPSMRETAPK